MKLQRRKLSRAHFAFMRALAQGVDARHAWERYLNVEGRSADLRLVNATVNWIRDEFAAAARRQGRPGTARLVKLDPTLLPRGQDVPDLAQFAAERGMEEFSQAEQAEAFAEVYGPVSSADSGRYKRRARLIERQLEGLAWLEALVAEDPAPGDSVGAWLAPAMASRLEAAGIPTLFALAERINGRGEGWFRGIVAIGTNKAARLVRWMSENQFTIGVPMGAHVVHRRAALSHSALAAVVPPGTALRPLEKFLVPENLDGTAGAFRAPPGRCLLSASTDYQAVVAWLNSKHALPSGALSATQRAYRKEAERLLLWAILERGKPLSSLTVEDASAYLAFLARPPAHWCGQRHHQRWSPLWRPLEGALKVSAQGHAITVLRILYTWLMTQGYLIGNPFAAVLPPRVPARPLGAGRMLTLDVMGEVMNRLDDLPDTLPNRRLQLALPWLYATGLRLAEMVDARCGHLQFVEYLDNQGQISGGWLQTVVGKGGRLREVPVPARLVQALKDDLRRSAEFGEEEGKHGGGHENREVTAPIHAQRPILARFVLAEGQEEEQKESEGEGKSTSHGEPKKVAKAIAAGGLYKALKKYFADCASQLDAEDPTAAARLRLASSHWLRHSHASHAVNGQPGRPGVPVQVMKENLGHASLATTSGYITTERDMRLAAMQGFFAETAVRREKT